MIFLCITHDQLRNVSLNNFIRNLSRLRLLDKLNMDRTGDY